MAALGHDYVLLAGLPRVVALRPYPYLTWRPADVLTNAHSLAAAWHSEGGDGGPTIPTIPLPARFIAVAQSHRSHRRPPDACPSV